MPISLAKHLVRYRNLSVALANAAVTWIILIIAPLGLFAVIVCTVAVFISSLILGQLGDIALNELLLLERQQLQDLAQTADPIAPPFSSQSDRTLENRQRRELPDP